MLYLAERRRGYVFQVLLISAIGALAILFAFYGFRPAAFSYVFTGGAARFWFSLAGMRGFIFDRGFAGSLANFPILTAACVAALLYCAVRRSRYFGNTTPLLVVFALAPIVTTQTVSAPWLWALPFFFTFIGGVFADALETRTRKLFLVITGAILAAQAMACLAALPLSRAPENVKPSFWPERNRMDAVNTVFGLRLYRPRKNSRPCLSEGAGGFSPLNYATRIGGASAPGPYAGKPQSGHRSRPVQRFRSRFTSPPQACSRMQNPASAGPMPQPLPPARRSSGRAAKCPSHAPTRAASQR